MDQFPQKLPIRYIKITIFFLSSSSIQLTINITWRKSEGRIYTQYPFSRRVKKIHASLSFLSVEETVSLPLCVSRVGMLWVQEREPPLSWSRRRVKFSLDSTSGKDTLVFTEGTPSERELRGTPRAPERLVVCRTMSRPVSLTVPKNSTKSTSRRALSHDSSYDRYRSLFTSVTLGRGCRWSRGTQDDVPPGRLRRRRPREPQEEKRVLLKGSTFSFFFFFLALFACTCSVLDGARAGQQLHTHWKNKKKILRWRTIEGLEIRFATERD